MNIKTSLTRAFLLTATCILLGGCGSNPYRLSAKDLAAFKDAPPEIRLEWETGLKADQANDFLAASTNFRSLLSKNITADQLVALQTALGGLNARMHNAAANGDVAAQKALEALEANRPRR